MFEIHSTMTHQGDQCRKGIHVCFQAESIGGEGREELENDLRDEINCAPQAYVLGIELQLSLSIDDSTKLLDKTW